MNCENWLKAYLTGGPVQWEMVRAAARTEGFTKGDLTLARRNLNVVSRRLKVDGEESWTWELPREKRQ